MRCTATCSGIPYEGPLYKDLKFCRSFAFNSTIELYVKPSADVSMELGTKAFPYKSIQNAAVDINQNINNRTNVDLVLKLASKNRIELYKYSLFVENLKSFTITTFSIDDRIKDENAEYSLLSVTDIY